MRRFDLSQAAPKVYARAHPQGIPMTKVISLLLLALMAVQLIYPLGLPGLRKRADFWKIAVLAIAVMMLTVVVRPG